MVDAVCWPGLSGEFRRRNGCEIAGFDSLPVPLTARRSLRRANRAVLFFGGYDEYCGSGFHLHEREKT